MIAIINIIIMIIIINNINIITINFSEWSLGRSLVWVLWCRVGITGASHQENLITSGKLNHNNHIIINIIIVIIVNINEMIMIIKNPHHILLQISDGASRSQWFPVQKWANLSGSLSVVSRVGRYQQTWLKIERNSGADGEELTWLEIRLWYCTLKLFFRKVKFYAEVGHFFWFGERSRSNAP